MRETQNRRKKDTGSGGMPRISDIANGGSLQSTLDVKAKRNKKTTQLSTTYKSSYGILLSHNPNSSSNV